jgi:hypothetical protein
MIAFRQNPFVFSEKIRPPAKLRKKHLQLAIRRLFWELKIIERNHNPSMLQNEHGPPSLSNITTYQN